jgi:hypothetical protein
MDGPGTNLIFDVRSADVFRDQWVVMKDPTKRWLREIHQTRTFARLKFKFPA